MFVGSRAWVRRYCVQAYTLTPVSANHAVQQQGMKLRDPLGLFDEALPLGLQSIHALTSLGRFPR